MTRRPPRLDATRGHCPGCGGRPKVPPTCAGRPWWCTACLQAKVAAAARAAGIPPDQPPARHHQPTVSEVSNT
jgi:hypothetical protein